MRILVVSDVSPLHIEGGGERVLWEHATRLAHRGHAIHVACRCAQPTDPTCSERQGVHLWHFPIDRGSLHRFLWTSVVEARRTVTALDRKIGAEVLHIHQPLAGLGALHSPIGRRLPSLYTFHSPAPLEYRSRQGATSRHRGGFIGHLGVALLWVIERSCLRLATRIHVLSDFSADLLWRLYRVPRDRIVKIPGGADMNRFHPIENRIVERERLGIPAGRPLLLTVRNLEARMGLDTLIRALDILRRHMPDVMLLIGGSGPLREPLENLSESLSLHGHVRFLGYIPEPDLARYYQAADLFVLPTRELEGFGLITVEALASGTPVLGTAIGGTSEVLRPLDPTLVFPDATPERMAAQLREFLERATASPEGYAALRQACRRYAVERYDWDCVVDQLEETLLALARKGKTAQPSQFDGF